MLEILSGFLAGILSGMGMGGGTVLILCLTLFLGMNQKMAQATNLVFFIPTSIAAIYINKKQKHIHFKIAKGIILTGIIGAIIGAFVAQQLEVTQLKKFFGVFLIGIALHEIYIWIKEYKILQNHYNK